MRQGQRSFGPIKPSTTEAMQCGNMATCRACEDTVAPEQELPRGNQIWHKICFNIYKAHLPELAKNPRRKAWWNSKDSKGKAAWYRTKRLQKEAGQKLQFDDHAVVEEEKEEAHEDEDDLWDYLPWAEYLKEQCKLPGATEQSALDNWNRDLMDPDVEKTERRGQTCVAVWRGVRRTVGTRKSTATSLTRRRKLDDVADVGAAIEESRKKVRAHAEKLLDGAPAADNDTPEGQVPASMICMTPRADVPNAIQPSFVSDVGSLQKARIMEDKTQAEDEAAIFDHHQASREKIAAGKSPGNFKVVLINSVTTRSQRVKNHLETLEKGIVEINKKMEEHAKAEADEQKKAAWDKHVTTLRAQLEVCKAKVTAFLLTASMEELDKHESVEAMATFSESVKDAEAALMNVKGDGALGVGRQLLRSATRIYEAELKAKKIKEEKAAIQVAVGGMAGHKAPKLPVNVSELVKKAQEAGKTRVNVRDHDGEDFHEGVVHWVREVEPKKAIAVQITGLPIWKSQMNWVRPKMQKEGRATSVSDFSGNAGAKTKLAQTVRQNFDKPFGCVEFEDAEPRGASVCHVQSFVNEAEKCIMGASPWGCPQSIVMLAGEEYVFGVPWEAVPGEDMKAKQQHVDGSTADVLFALFTEKLGSFVVKLTVGKLTNLPGDCLLLHVTGAEGSSGIRWGIVPSSPEGVELAVKTLQSMIGAFPALATSDYQAWLQKLTSAKPLVRVQ